MTRPEIGRLPDERSASGKFTRPTVWTPEKLAAARAMVEEGEHDVATIARILGVSRASVYRGLASRGQI